MSYGGCESCHLSVCTQGSWTTGRVGKANRTWSCGNFVPENLPKCRWLPQEAPWGPLPQLLSPSPLLSLPRLPAPKSFCRPVFPHLQPEGPLVLRHAVCVCTARRRPWASRAGRLDLSSTLLVLSPCWEGRTDTLPSGPGQPPGRHAQVKGVLQPVTTPPFPL